jgi:hypothetical protein
MVSMSRRGKREYTHMTTVTFHRRTKPARRVRPKTGRTRVSAVDVIAASAFVIRPVCVSAALIAAVVMWPGRAHADNGDAGSGDAGSTVLNSVGIGNNGPISSAIAQVGTSICPMLVQPGSAFASNAAQMSGNGGLAAPIAGWVIGAAIQSQCPAFMTAISNGDLSMLTGGGTPAPTPFGLPGANPLLPGALGLPGVGAPAPTPFGLPGLTMPGVNPPAPSPFGIPAANPPAPSPFGVPGL